MAKDFYAAIKEIMPLVRGGDTSAPFAITRDAARGGWQIRYPRPAENARNFLESQRARDACAVMFTGKDFANGTFAAVCDKALAARFQKEYDVARSSGKDTDEFHALASFCVNNISSFQQAATGCLANVGRPLKWLLDEFVTPQGIKPEQLCGLYLDGAGLDETLTAAIIAAIEERCAYEMNPDRPLIEKLRDNYAGRGAGDMGLFNLMMFIEKNSSAISGGAKDYLLTIGDPLDWLGFRIYEDGHELEKGIGADGGISGDELIFAIEDAIETARTGIGRRVDPGGAAGAAAYDAGKASGSGQTHIVIASYDFYGREIEIGEDTGNERPYYVKTGGEISMRTGSYMDALAAYSSQIGTWVDESRAAYEERVAQGLEQTALTDGHCLPGSKSADFTKQLIVVNAKYLMPECRNPESQLVECTHGSGARPGAKGARVFGKELRSGASVLYGRHEILGVADEGKLPQWAKMKLEKARAARQPAEAPDFIKTLNRHKAKSERGKAANSGKPPEFHKRNGQEVV